MPRRCCSTSYRRLLILAALSRLSSDTHVVWLDPVLPTYWKDTFNIDGPCLGLQIREDRLHEVRCDAAHHVIAHILDFFGNVRPIDLIIGALAFAIRRSSSAWCTDQSAMSVS